MNTLFSIFAWNSFATRRPAGAASLARWRRAGRFLGLVLPLLVGGAGLTLAQEAPLEASAPLRFAATGRGPQGAGLYLAGSLSGWHAASLRAAPADSLLAEVVGVLHPGETLTAELPARAGQFARTVQLVVPATGGTGEFVLTPQAGGAAGNTPLGLAVGNLDGDPELDAVSIGADDNGFHAQVSQGLGRGRLATAGQVLALPGRPTAVALADLDRDGDLDLLITLGRLGDVLVLPGRGNGTFDTVGTTVHVSSLLVKAVAVGDVNGDGAADLVMTAFDPEAKAANSVRVYLGRGRELAWRPAQCLALPILPGAVQLGDLDHDGDLDVVATGASEVQVLLNAGHGRLVASAQLPLPSSPGAQLALADADQDGDLDLLLAEPVSSEVTVRLNSGRGTFGPASAGVNAPDDTRTLCVADVNGDGRPDLVLAYGNAASGGVAVRFGQGRGTFADNGPDLALPAAPYALAVADLDGDGDLDLLLPAATPNGLAPALNAPASAAAPLINALVFNAIK